MFYAQEDEEKIAYLAPTEAYIHYYFRSPQDNALKLNHSSHDIQRESGSCPET